MYKQVMKMNHNLRRLLAALYLELERIDWEDSSAFEVTDLEVDDEFDLMPSIDENPVEWEADLVDETDIVRWPLCVECGNFSPSCVC